MRPLYGRGSRRAAYLRGLYASGKGNASARRQARLTDVMFKLGLCPRRWVVLQVRGRRSGQLREFPLGMAEVGGRWHLVSMLGECAWTRNVRAADGRCVLVQRGRARPVRLVEVPSSDVRRRAVILKRYVERVPGGRPHVSVPPFRPVGDYVPIVARHPIFEVEGELSGP